MSAKAHILQSLGTNFLIATAKAVGAWFTGSGAMLAETLHSYADCGNQLLLLLGVRQAERPPDDKHPLGYGRDLYFWSFMVALLLFTGGGAVSIYEGVHKLGSPEPVENPQWAYAILGFSILLEGWSTWSNVQELNARRGGTPFFRYLQDTKDSDLIVVFGENSAATLGLSFAILAVVLSVVTHNPMWDAIGSIVIGVILVGVAVFLAREVKSLLVGEAADPAIHAVIDQIVVDHPDVVAKNSLISIQQGPGEVLVAMKLEFSPGIPALRVAQVVNEVEDELRRKRPEVRWCFVEAGLAGED